MSGFYCSRLISSVYECDENKDPPVLDRDTLNSIGERAFEEAAGAVLEQEKEHGEN